MDTSAITGFKNLTDLDLDRAAPHFYMIKKKKEGKNPKGNSSRRRCLRVERLMTEILR